MAAPTLSIDDALRAALERHAAGHLDEAAALYQQVLRQRPDDASALHNLGLLATQTRHHEDAIALLRRLVQLHPGNPAYYRTLANACTAGGKLEEAHQALQVALQIAPLDDVTVRDMAQLLSNMQRFNESILWYQRTLELRSRRRADEQSFEERVIGSQIWLNLGVACASLHRNDEAIACFERAIAVNDDFPKARMNLGYLYFRKGDLHRGFTNYAYRWKSDDFAEPWPDYPQPVWDGSALNGRTVLLWHEQGFGDTIQFVRYARLIPERGGKGIVLCQPPLKRLLQQLEMPGVRIIASGEETGEFDVHLPLLNLPVPFETTRETVPFREGYLKADQSLAAGLAERIQKDLASFPDPKPLRVGIVWAGSAGHKNDLARSLRLEALLPILGIEGVRFYSLQKSDAAEQLKAVQGKIPIVDWTPDLSDFADTAALISNLDLIITVDTSVAHLAGALGKEVWTLVAHEPDFRWLADDGHTCWYASMRLFRQPAPGNWPAVIQQVGAELRRKAGASGPPQVSATSGSAPNPEVEELLRRAQHQHATGRLPQAEQLYRSILARDPNNATAIHYLGMIAHQVGQHQAGINLMRRSIELAPSAPFYTNLATSLRSVGRHEEALEALQASLRLAPDDRHSHFNLAHTVARLGKLEEAVVAYRRAFELQPPEGTGEDAAQRQFEARMHNSSASVLGDLGRYDEAIAECDRAIELAPDYAMAYRSRGYLHFCQGDLRRAFEDYEWRWKCSDFNQKWPEYPQPRWDGSDLSGKTVLLWNEQGLGDSIQFARYAPLIAQRGGKAVVLVQRDLKRLLQSLQSDRVRVVGRDEPLPAFDLHLPLMSLPHAFQTTRQTIPAAAGYLKPDSQEVEKWAARLSTEEVGPKPLRVGIVWAGSAANPLDASRSIPLQALSPLLKVEGVRWFSLQKGDAAKQLQNFQSADRITDWTADLHDFADTAALIADLDLIISADTAVAHLAGAMGKPTWLLLPFKPDFRWAADSESSSWYDSVRLFRQQSAGDWAEVVDRVGSELRGMLAQRSQPAPPDVRELLERAQQLHLSGRNSEAEALYRDVLRHDPEHPAALNHLGLLEHKGGRNAEAIELLKRSIARDPSIPYFHRNLALALRFSGHLDEAAAALETALRLDPSDASAHMELSEVLMARGDFPRAWDEYEWRFRCETHALPWPQTQQPAWEGSDLTGRTIVLWCEQGFGDAIQFARFASVVADRGGKVVIYCRPPLKRLLQRVRGVAEVAAEGERVPSFDFHLPLMSVPRVLRTTLDSIPSPDGYLQPDPASVEAWSAKVQASTGPATNLRLGIVWAGNPQHRNDRNRSIPFDAFAPLLGEPGIIWFSLQKGAHAEDLRNTATNVPAVDLTHEVADFADTAALIANLDLVISADTSVAHLAAAMGKPVWMLLPTVGDSRWMLDTPRTPWYGSMRLFRQTSVGNWAGVIEQVRAELKLFKVPARDAANPLREAMSSPTPSAPLPLPPALAGLLQQAHEHHAAGRLQQAEPLYRQVLAHAPNNADALHHLGLLALQCGHPEPAIELMQRSIAADPNKPFFLKNLASAYRTAGRFDEAIQWNRKALDLMPDDPTVLEELGIIYEKLDRLDESIQSHQSAIQLIETRGDLASLPDSNRRRAFEAKARMNLGAALFRNQQFEQAAPQIERSVELSSNSPLAHMHLANVLFRRRQLPQAWAEYEWRFRCKGFPTAWPNYPQPVWDGSDLRGRTILLWPEQGLGDVIQFARFIPQLIERGGKVVLRCMPSLKRILQTLPASVQIVGNDEPLSGFDVHLPLISLPRVLGTTYETIPAPKSYLSADPQLAADWARKLENSSAGPRVGLVWSGSPSFPQNHRRSIPLVDLLPLADLRGISWHSLQFGDAARQLDTVRGRLPITDFTADLHDFADTAALIANLDLVIATDTATVHLAGAMGKETWVLLWTERDFRWLMDDKQNPWYPTVRIFRQSRMGYWGDVVERVKGALIERARLA